MKRWFVVGVLSAAVAGCASTRPTMNPGKAVLVGVGLPKVYMPIAMEQVYFMSVDGQKQHRSGWDGYPTKLELDPGSHRLTVICEWLPPSMRYTLAKNSKDMEAVFEAGHIYQFKSSIKTTDDFHGCVTDIQDVTSTGSN